MATHAPVLLVHLTLCIATEIPHLVWAASRPIPAGRPGGKPAGGAFPRHSVCTTPKPRLPLTPVEAPVLVVAVGDPSAGKDAVGPLILAEIEREALPRNVTVCSLGKRPDRLPDVVASVTQVTGPLARLVLLDAVTSATEPEGTVVEQPITDTPPASQALSSHTTTLTEAVGLLHLQLGRNTPARIMLVGVVVGTVADGPMPGRAARAIPQAAVRARALLEDPERGRQPDPPG